MNQFQKYNIRLERIPILDQGETGRCWLFAGINHLRHLYANQKNQERELSTVYLSALDKYEKSNCFFDNIINHPEAALDDRMIQHWLNHPCSDLGQWTMFVNLVNKYGVMPYDALPETKDSMNSWKITACLNNHLRAYAKTLRGKSLSAEKKDELKMDMLCRIIDLLREYYHFAELPEIISHSSAKDIAGLRYYSDYFSDYNLDDYYCFMHAPNLEYYQYYDLVGTQNVIESYPIQYLNLPLDMILQCIIKQLEDGLTVWFGVDAGKFYDQQSGFFDVKMQNNQIDQPVLALSKAERLDYGCSIMTHAMNIVGVQRDSGNHPLQWLAENTKGVVFGDEGYIHITNDWMREFAYQFVIHKKYIPNDTLVMAEQSVHGVLYPWSPLGSLAGF